MHELSLPFDQVIWIVDLPGLNESQLFEGSDLMVSDDHPHCDFVEPVSLNLEVTAYARDLLPDVYWLNVGLHGRANVAWQLNLLRHLDTYVRFQLNSERLLVDYIVLRLVGLTQRRH